MSRFDIPNEELPRALSLLSIERMGVYMSITGSEREAILLHDQMLRTASELMPVLALIEICLRNAISEQLKMMFGNADWLQCPPAPFEWRGEEKNSIKRALRHAQRAAYTKRNQHQKKQLDKIAFPEGLPNNLSHEARVLKRQKAIAVTVGQIVAQLTLAFWKRLFSSDYQATLWDRALKRMYPNKVIIRANVAENLEIIYQSRNRIAHHEPLFGDRLDKTLIAIDYIAANFGSKLDGGFTLLEGMIATHRHRLGEEVLSLSQSITKFTIKATAHD